MPRLLLLLSIFCSLLMACAKPAVDVSDILKKVREIDADTSLLVKKKVGAEKPFDSIVEIEYSLNGRLLKYVYRHYRKDTSETFLFYSDDDSMIYWEQSAIIGNDTLSYSRRYYRHGVCVHADESEESIESVRASTFYTGQFNIDNFRANYERANGREAPEDTTLYTILPYSTVFPLFGYNAANTELHYNNLAKIEAVIGDHMYRILNHSVKDRSLKETDFKRQYVAVINDKGEKEVWVNCFCRNKVKDWRKEVVDSMDSEGYYFHFKLNLNDGGSYDFRSGLGSDGGKPKIQ